MARKRKLSPWFITLVREEVGDSNYFKRRYFYFKIQAFEFAEDYYDPESTPEKRLLAYQNFVRCNKKASWYYKKINLNLSELALWLP